MCLAASALAQTPVINAGGVMNGASFRPAAATGGGVAAGSIVSIFGSNLATRTAAATALPLPTTLNGTSVTIGGRSAPLFYVSAGQINAQVPWATPAGTQAVVVTLNSAPSAAVNVTVQTASPGIFSQSSSGHGSGAIQSFFSQGNTPLNTLTTAIAPGGILIIYATGLGAVNVPPTDGAAGAAQSTTNAVTVRVGGQDAVNADSATLATGFVGLYQVNVRVPATTPEGCYVPVQVLVGGQLSNTVTAAVAKNRDCTALASESSPMPNSSVGHILLTRVTGGGILEAGFFRYGAVAVDPNLAPPAGGGCLVDIYTSSSHALLSGGVSLTAGPLTYTPPSGVALTLNRDVAIGGIYRGDVPVAPGAHTVRGAGGTNVSVGAFTAAITLPSQFSGTTNVAGSTVSQGQGFTPTWNTCPDPNGKVVVSISSLSSSGVAGSAICSAACIDRTLLLDSTVLSQLPPGPATVLLTYLASPVRFTATGLDGGFLVFADRTLVGGLTLVP
jgi:uncharacterized protein (TIGR03437 family)